MRTLCAACGHPATSHETATLRRAGAAAPAAEVMHCGDADLFGEPCGCRSYTEDNPHPGGPLTAGQATDLARAVDTLTAAVAQLTATITGRNPT